MKPLLQLISAAAALCLLVIGQAGAADVAAEAPITAVTVFSDRAMVTRELEVSLASGRSTVVVGGLPRGLIAESLRVEGTGELTIGSAEVKPVFEVELVREEERRLKGELEGLQDEKRALDDRIAAAKLQLEFISALGRDIPETANEEIVRGALNPEAWRAAWQLVGEGAASALEAIRGAAIERREVEEKIAQVRRALGQIQTGAKATAEARINVETEGAVKGRLKFSYQILGAAWRPLYDARLDSDSGRVRLTQIGEVRQASGEDWSGVALTLSTARPARGARMPDLATWFIDFYEPPIVLSDEAAMEKSVTILQSPEPAARQERAAEVQQAEIHAAEFSASYAIAGQANIPADRTPHKFVIAEREFEAHLAVRIVPKITRQAYLFGEVTYEGEDSLLPGPVSLFRDGTFVGTGGLALSRPGETFKLSFGVDEKVRIDYSLLTGERSQEGLIHKDQRLERRYRIEVANFHARPIEVTLLDQLPVPRDERIKVEFLSDSTKPTDIDVEGRTGVLAWRDAYAPGQERTILFGYAVSFPEGLEVPGF
jgi:uncharacterized protein (TIGR02231 family)